MVQLKGEDDESDGEVVSFDHEQSEPTTKCDEEFIGPVTFEIEDEEIEIPTSVLKSTAYLQSHLATVAKGLHPHSGKALPRNHNGNVIVTNTTKEIFRLLIAFLCGEDPLSREPFDRVIEVYETLLSETIKWRLSRARLSLPARFWTVSRWSDGNSFFALREKDIQLLTPLPVAKSAISPHNPPVHLQVLPPLEPDQRPPAYDQIAEIAREEPERLKAWGGVDAAVTVALVESEFVTIFFFLPDMREPLAFQSRCRHLTELLPETPREMRNYPHVVAEDENETRQVWFNSHEGIEIRRTNTYRMRQLSSEVPPTQPESLWSRAVWGQANPPLAPIEPKEWTAFHPAIKDTVYKSSMLEYGFVAESLRFYSWGCLVVGRRNRTNLASGLIASVSVDHGDLKEIYQSRINIYLKCNLYDYEIAVSQDLSRVYLCVDGSLLSQALTPMLNRVVFELIPPTAPAKAAKSKLCHVDIAEGAPTAQNLQGFRCLGVLAEFDCYTGVYMQAAISRPLCSITRHVFFNKGGSADLRMIPHQTLPPPPGTRPAAPPAPPRPAFPPASPFPPMMIDPSMLAAMSDPKLLMAMSSMLIPGGPAPQQTPELEKPPTEAQPETATSLWKEFKTAEGRVFWHNSKTNKSTWDKPDELKTDLERVLATTTMWREYPGGDGKTYWHHLETKQSEWDVPKEVSDIRQVMTELEAEDWTELSKKWETKNHARNAFKEFLSRRGVGHLAKWDDVGKILQRDSKWKLFDCHLTTGERKHAFNEYVNQLQKKTREEQRLKKAAARDALTEFLNKWKNGENNMPPLTGETVYEDFRELAHGEDWWHVLDIRDKAEAFEDLAQQVSRECMQRVPRDLMNQVVQFFEDVLGDELTPESEPDEIVAFLFSSFPADQFKGLHPLQVLDAWSAALRKYFDEEENQKEALQLTLERQNRENFRKLLADAEEEHLLNAKSDWLDFVSGPRPSGGQEGAPLSEEEASVLDRVVKRVTEWVHPGETESSAAGDAESAKGSDSVLRPQTKGVCEDMRYLRLFLQGGSTPRELFEDYVYSLWDIYEELRSVVKDKLTVEGELGQRLIGEPTASLLEFKEILLRDKQLSVPAEMVAKADRPGVLLPLVSSLAKRLKKATQSKQEEELDDAEEGQLKSRPNSARP